MLYKVLNENGTSPYRGFAWPLPKGGKSGAWVRAEGPLVLCGNGVHLCDGERQLLSHLGPTIWEAEVRGGRVDGNDKIVVREARLVRRIDQWNDRTARLFAALCAEHVLPIFEAVDPNDSRPRDAIEVARRFADGDASREEMRVAHAAYACASAYAYASASAHVVSACASASAYASAHAASASVHASAHAASASASASASAHASARRAERAWQADRLAELLSAPGDWTIEQEEPIEKRNDE